MLTIPRSTSANSKYLHQSHAGPVRFGSGQPAPGLTSSQMEAYQAAILQSFPQFKKYGNINFEGGYNRLFFETKKVINNIAQKVSPNNIIDYNKRHLFGPVEESSDAMFELWSLRAIQKKWLTQDQAHEWAQIVQECRKNKVPFNAYLEKLRVTLPKETFKQFQEMTQLPVEHSDMLLTLLVGKFGIYASEQRDFDMKENTKPLLLNETKELFEHEPFSLSKVAFYAMSWAYTHLPILPVNLFDKLMMKYVDHRLKLPISFEAATNMQYQKFLNRQHLQYKDQNGQIDFATAYNARKADYKPIEAILEAGTLYNAEKQAQKEKMNVVA